MSQSRRSIAANGQEFSASPGGSWIVAKTRAILRSPSSGDVTTEEIPLTHRLAIIYLTLPVVIWLVGWFEWWFGVPAAVLLAVGLWRALAPPSASFTWQAFSDAIRSALRPATVALLLIAFAWVMTTSGGGIFDLNNADWEKHRALMLELSRGDWPTQPLQDFRDYVNQPIVLRHYLGFHIVPGLLGKLLGLAALNWAVPLWTWSGVALILLMFNRGYRGWRTLVAALVLIFFSGMDALRIALFEGWDVTQFSLRLDGWPNIELGRQHLEWEGLDSLRIQISSHMVGLLWVPKHFIPAALYGLLLVQLRRHGRFLGISGLVLAVAPFWSPFVAIGLLPFVIALVIERGIRPFLSWQNLLVALPLASLLFVYLSSGVGDVPRSWIWERHENGPLAALFALAILYLSEFAILGSLLLLLRPQLRHDSYFVASLATLVLLPLYSLGYFNDFAMRGVMPALFLLCYYCVGTVAGSPINSVGKGRLFRLPLFMLLVGALAVGAVTPLVELARANNYHNFDRIRHEQLGEKYSIKGILVENPPDVYVPLYLTNQLPVWYLRLFGLDPGDVAPAKGELVIRSAYDVYIDDRTLVYVKGPCPPDLEGTQFFVQVNPLDASSLPRDRTRFYFDFPLTPAHALRIGETCYAIHELADSFQIGQLQTGQSNAESSGHIWMASYFSEPYRIRLITEAGAPIIRSAYDVYLHQDRTQLGATQSGTQRLLFSKGGCGQGDDDARFYVHVFPVNLDDLSDEGKNEGHDTLEFDLNEYGGSSGGSCFAAIDLPDYDIFAIRAGQFLAGGGTLWEGSFILEEYQ